MMEREEERYGAREGEERKDRSDGWRGEGGREGGREGEREGGREGEREREREPEALRQREGKGGMGRVMNGIEGKGIEGKRRIG